MTFTLTLAQAVTEAVTVNYVTSDGTATAGQDYTAVTSGEATIPANSTSATFTVSVTGDTTDEANETFNVTISLPEPEPDLNGSGNGEHLVAIVGGRHRHRRGDHHGRRPCCGHCRPKGGLG